MHYGYRKINQKNSPLLCLPVLQPETFCEFSTPYGLPSCKISIFFNLSRTIMFNLKDHCFSFLFEILDIKVHISRLRRCHRLKFCTDIRPSPPNKAANFQPDWPWVQWSLKRTNLGHKNCQFDRWFLAACKGLSHSVGQLRFSLGGSITKAIYFRMT